jgi:hypothetical protein
MLGAAAAVAAAASSNLNKASNLIYLPKFQIQRDKAFDR